jgi:hypothetical protein
VAASFPAPWVPPGTHPPEAAALRAARIVFARDRLSAPGWMACPAPRYDIRSVPAEGLFEGGLHDPAAGRADAPGLARGLGVAQPETPTLSVRCHGIQFHLAAPDLILFALDNRIYRLHRAGNR